MSASAAIVPQPQPSQRGRLGRNFTLRITPLEWAALLEAQARSPGPRDLGPWMLWKLLDGQSPRRAQQLSLAGLLCAPSAGGAVPGTEFSLARNGHEVPPDFVEGMATVNACMRVIFTARPRWWALENPVGYLQRFLGPPRDTWEPHEFGDSWSKRTAIWGDYELPQRGPFVQPLWGGGPPCDEHGDRSTRQTGCCSRPGCRAKTPPGFARAFCEANP